MGYQKGSLEPKAKTDEDSILPGSIGLQHLSPELFRQIRSIAAHAHEGVTSRRIYLDNLEGNETYLFSPNGSRWKITVSNAGALVVSAA